MPTFKCETLRMFLAVDKWREIIAKAACNAFQANGSGRLLKGGADDGQHYRDKGMVEIGCANSVGSRASEGTEICDDGRRDGIFDNVASANDEGGDSVEEGSAKDGSSAVSTCVLSGSSS